MPLPIGGRASGNNQSQRQQQEDAFALPDLDNDEVSLPSHRVEEPVRSSLEPPVVHAAPLPGKSLPPVDSPVREPVKNIFDDDEDPFEADPVDEEIDDLLHDEDDEYEEEEVVEVEPPVVPKQSQKKKVVKQLEGNPVEPQEEFIDKKNKKLLPFGRPEFKKKQKPSGDDDDAIDPRRDLARSSKYWKWGIVGLTSLLIGLGVYQTAVPPDTLSEDEVAAVAQQAVGKTGFPIERGEAFALNFMKAYLSVQGNDTMGDRLLGYYYNGTMGGDFEPRTRSFSNDYRQRVLLGPTIYDVLPASGYSTTYIVGAVVQPENAKTKAPADGSAAKWTFYAVNMYYDKETDSVAIDPDSPSIVPAPNVLSSAEIPDPQKVGNGESDTDLRDEISSVVTGYLKGYAQSSASDHAAIDQYIIPDPPPSLLTGLDGRFALEKPEDVAYEVYHTDDPNIVKADLKVSWSDKPTSKVSSSYVSSYVMTLQKQENGKYLVTKFAPKYYFMEPK